MPVDASFMDDRGHGPELETERDIRQPDATLTPVIRWARWRGLILSAVIAFGVIAMQAGADVSDRPGMPEAGFLTQLYYVLGLFVLGGLDVGVPDRGPQWAQALLWFVYFAAPAVTTSALVEAVLRAVRPHALKRRLRGHIVIGGCGRLAMLYMRKLRERDRKSPVVVVERSLDNPYIHAAEANYDVTLVHADMSSVTLLDSLKLADARRVLLFSGDDHQNLDTAARIVSIAPQLKHRVVAHVSDLRLLRVIESRQILEGVRLFNSYRTAARHLVSTLLVPHFHATAGRDTVVLAGFGRFGQTVLHELQSHALNLFERVMIVDLHADRLVHVFAEQVGFASSYTYTSFAEDIQEPRTWRHLTEQAEKPEEETVFVLASGVDSVNIRTALWLAERMPEAMIVARCFRRSGFTEDISRECNFHVVSTAELLLERFHHNGYLSE